MVANLLPTQLVVLAVILACANQLKVTSVKAKTKLSRPIVELLACRRASSGILSRTHHLGRKHINIMLVVKNKDKRKPKRSVIKLMSCWLNLTSWNKIRIPLASKGMNVC